MTDNPKTAAQHNSQLTGTTEKFVDGEINPNHPVTRTIHDHWHKVAAMLMWKLKRDSRITSVTITPGDIDAMEREDLCVMLHSHRDSLEVKLLPRTEAEKIAREHAEGGGLAI